MKTSTACILFFFAYTVDMGSERVSTTRLRLAGRICCNCKISLPPPHTPGEKFCTKCQASSGSKRRVYLHFMLLTGWHCQFLEADLKTPLPKKLTLPDPETLIQLAERGGYKAGLEGRQALEHAIETGRGGVWLELTEAQYRKLKRDGDDRKL